MSTDRRNAHRDFDPTIIHGFLNGRSIENSEQISTGKSNTNISLELSDGERVIVRLYSQSSQSGPAREKAIAELVGDSVPIPKILDHGEDWAVFEFVEGELLQAHPELSGAVARVIPALMKIEFDAVGWITTTGEVTPFDFGDGYFATMLSNTDVVRWLGDERVQTLSKILSNEKSRLEEINSRPSVTHGDFNPTNVLVHNGAVSAVLDWEYAHAGTPYMDIGNLLRNVDQSHHDAIQQGLIDGGFDLPNDWKERAALIDMSSHLEFLTSTRSDQFKKSRVALIDTFIEMFSG